MVNVIDYMPGDTLLHRLNPVIKLGLAAAIIIGIFLSDTYVALLGFLALTLVLGAYAGVVNRLFSLLKLLIPLALIMLVLQLAFMRDGNVVWGFVTDEGLITGTKACLRLLGVALPLILMLMVTKLNDLANACVEVLHVPYRYAFTFTTALRFVPVFGQEMNAIMEAQTARGVEYDTRIPSRNSSSCCRCACHCLFRAWARPMPPRLPPSSAASTCARVRVRISATPSKAWISPYLSSVSPLSPSASFSSSPPTATAQRKGLGSHQTSRGLYCFTR